LRANWSTSDFTLLELDEMPDPAFGVTYAGWYRGDALATSAVGIHHPSTDEKSISFENAAVRLTSYTSTVEPGDGTHLRVIDWDLGTTEGGSSGSPLFDSEHRVVGQLHGGYAACGNNESDWYGWLNRSWTGGGTRATRLVDWLDPAGTGVMAVPLLDPSASQFAVTPVTGVELSGPVGGPFSPSSWDYTLTNEGTNPAGFTAAVDQSWLTVAPTAGTVPAEGSATVTVSLAAAATDLAAGRYTAALSVENPGRGTVETRTFTLEILPDTATLVAVAPNPFKSYVTVRMLLPAAGEMSWTVHDLRGRLVRGPVKQAGFYGENDITWDGKDASGRRQSSGSYVLTVTAAGQEFRAAVTCGR
jgi:hypothetical protein